MGVLKRVKGIAAQDGAGVKLSRIINQPGFKSCLIRQIFFQLSEIVVQPEIFPTVQPLEPAFLNDLLHILQTRGVHAFFKVPVVAEGAYRIRCHGTDQQHISISEVNCGILPVIAVVDIAATCY